MLQSQIFGHARDLCKGISAGVNQSPGGADEIVNAIYNRDALSVVSQIYQKFINSLSTKCDSTELLNNFESEFAAQISKFNSYSSTT